MIESFEVAELAENLSLEDDTKPSAPLLKYQPILHGVSDLTSMDKIACIACHGKFLAIGTALGRVYVLDHEGFATENGVHSMHRGPVNQISISENGDYMASCGDDGRIVIYNVSDFNDNEVFSVDEAVKSVAIAPDYSHSPVIAIGHSKLLLLTKGMFKRNKHGEITKANGLIDNIKWRGDILIWTDDQRVGVYDLRNHQHISYIQFSQQTATLYTRHVPCHINWCTDTCFLIGRGSSLRICQILERYLTPERRDSSSKGSSGRSSSIHIPTDSSDSPMGLANRYVELSYQVDVANSLVCGLSRHQTQLLALVVPNIALCSQSSSSIPLELQIIQVDDLDTVPAANREPVFHREQQTWVTPRGKRGYADVHLETVPGEDTHYIATPAQLICVKALTNDDHIDWLLEHGDFEQALQLASEHAKRLERHTSQSVGLNYVEHLMENGKFDLAASVCGRVIVEKPKWEQLVHKFMRFGQLPSLVPFIPVGSKELPVLLSHAVYESVLLDFMDRDPEQFLDLLSTWGRRNLLDSFDALLRTVLDRIDRQACLTGISEPSVLEPGLRCLRQASALLYELVGSPDKALDILIQLRDPKVFELFDRRSGPPSSTDHRLIEALKERVDYFMQLDAPRAVSVLLDHVVSIPPEHVIGQLEGQPELLFHYLDGAYARYPKLVVPYTTQLIQLYTRFRREKLLPLLRSTDSYRLSDALAICEQAKLVPETVYLLTRIGRRHDALQLIMTQGVDSTSNTDNESDPTAEEQRQSRAAAAAIAYCCEEDALRSQFRLNFGATSSPRSIFGVPMTNAGDQDDDEYQSDSSHNGELWQQVVLFAVDKPAFICALLQHAGSEGLDPRLLLRKISPDLSIPGLRDSLVKLMRNYKLQLELLRSCRRVLRTDASKLFARLLQQQARGICVQPGGFSSVSCCLCSNQLVVHTRPGESQAKQSRPQTDDDGSQSTESRCLVFHCRHVTHSECVPSSDDNTKGVPACPVCAKS